MQGLTILFIFQILGQFLQDNLISFIPGPLLGMMLLFLCLHIMPRLHKPLINTTNLLFKHLMLIYIVYGVGLINYLGYVRNSLFYIILLVVIAGMVTITLSSLIGKRIKQ